MSTDRRFQCASRRWTKRSHSPYLGKQRAEAGPDDRNPPSQECRAHPAKETRQQTKGKTPKNDKIRSQRLISPQWRQRIAHSDHRFRIEQTQNQKTPSYQGKSRDPNLHSETSEIKIKCRTKGDRLPVTFRHAKPFLLTVAIHLCASASIFEKPSIRLNNHLLPI